MYKVNITDLETGKTVTDVKTDAVLCGYVLPNHVGVDSRMLAAPEEIAQLIIHMQNEIELFVRRYPVMNLLLRAYRKGPSV